MSNVRIYTDGVCPRTPGHGGWGAVLLAGERSKEAFGTAPDASTNRMELLACIEALRLLKKPCSVELFTDSTYIVDGITQWIEGWKKNHWRNKDREPIKNDDLWKALDEVSAQHDICWTWIKRASDPHNCLAHDLASKALESLNVPLEHEPALDRSADIHMSQDTPAPVTGDQHGRLVVVHTDGSCLGNPGPGGWAVIIQGGGITTELSGGEDNTTNNRMELYAAIQALEGTQAEVVRMVTDSKYVINGVSEWLSGWKKNNWRSKDGKAVKNLDLWRRMDVALQGKTVNMEWVKGHNGHPLNERCDELAQAESRKIKAARLQAGTEASS